MQQMLVPLLASLPASCCCLPLFPHRSQAMRLRSLTDGWLVGWQVATVADLSLNDCEEMGLDMSTAISLLQAARSTERVG